MSIVALTVSSGCHIASAAFKPTLLGNAAPQCCFKILGEIWKKGEKKKKKASVAEPLPDRSQHWRLCHLLVWERRSKPRLLGNGVLWGATGDLEELFTHNFIIGLLSQGSMPVLLPTPSTQLFESLGLAPV